MAWLEIHQALPAHRKTLAAADALDMHPVHFMGHIITFWLWALDNVPDGNLDEVSARMIARAAQWEGDPDTLLNTLIEVGFIDQDDDGLAIHDWYDYAGKLMEQRAKERERSRKRRAEQRRRPQEKDRGSTAGHPEDDREKTVGTVPNRTVPNSTNNKEYTCAPDGARAYTAPSPGGSVEAEKVTATPDGDKPSSKSGPRSPFKSKRQEQLFDEFWKAYPKKRSKGRAERAWVKIAPDTELFSAILDGLERAKRSRDWTKEGGRYIPYPATWLNAKGWEDDYEEVRSSGNAHRGHQPYTEDDGYDWDKLARRS